MKHIHAVVTEPAIRLALAKELSRLRTLDIAWGLVQERMKEARHMAYRIQMAINSMRPKRSALVREGSVWLHAEFNVSIDRDNDIVIETETTLMSYNIEAARDLQQALAQAIAAAEVMAVTGETCPAHGVSWDDCPDCRR